MYMHAYYIHTHTHTNTHTHRTLSEARTANAVASPATQPHVTCRGVCAPMCTRLRAVKRTATTTHTAAALLLRRLATTAYAATVTCCH